jgi:hypothetical protein
METGALPRNPYICLAIIATLGTTLLIGTIGIIVLSFYGREPPQALVGIVGIAAGSLSSFLVSVPRGSAGWVDDRPQKKP